MDIEEFRSAGYKAIDHICDYFYSLRKMPVTSQVEPGYLRRALPSTAPQTGEAFEKITEDYFGLVVPGLVHWQHPRFFAYFPASSTFAAILGDLYASGIGCNPGFNWSVSPACTELEGVVMDWAAQMLGLGTAFHNSFGVGGGVIQTTASESALVAAVAARSRYVRQHPDVPVEKLVLYTTTQTHSLGKKAGLILGLNVRMLKVTAEDNYALRGAMFKSALEEDARAGRCPFMLIATVGTTSSGAVDRLGEICETIAATPSVWLHVDAAWAGMAMVCPEYRDLCCLSDINQHADSFCTNFNKLGLVNLDCSALWVRDRKSLTSALDVTPEFLRSDHGDAGTVIDYRNWHLGLTRRFRSLKLWFVLRTYGVQGFQQYIRMMAQLNDTFVSLIKQSAQFRLVAPPCLSLTVFRLEPCPCIMRSGAPSSSHHHYHHVQNHACNTLAHLNDEHKREQLLELNVRPEELNALNRAFHARLSARHDIAFTQTDLNGTICIRCSIGSESCEAADIVQAFEILCEEADKTLEDWGWSAREKVNQTIGQVIPFKGNGRGPSANGTEMFTLLQSLPRLAQAADIMINAIRLSTPCEVPSQ